MIYRFNDFLNEELDFKIIPCTYSVGSFTHNNILIDKYTFITNKQNSYTVYIHNTYESNHLFDDGTYLQDVNKYKPIPTIYFSMTNRGFDRNSFDTLTNNQEKFEVMGKVIFIISEFINNNPQYDVFSIGEVDKDKFNFYKNWLKQLPIRDMKIGLSDSYIDKNNNQIKAYYLIK